MNALLPVPALSEDLLPPALRPWLIGIAKRQHCPVEFPAVAALVGAGALIGRQVTIRPKAQDTWTEYGNLWGMVVGPPAMAKSSALKEALGSLYHCERLARERYQEERVKEIARKVREKDVKRRIEETAVLSDGKDLSDLEAEMRALQSQEIMLRRYVSNHATVDVLGQLLADNPNGLLIHRDELRGLFQRWERGGHEADRAFYLEGWSGNGSYASDRIAPCITSATTGMCLSLIGTIQPAPLAAIIRRAVERNDDDGLLPRLQLAVYPDVLPDGRETDELPDTNARDHRLFERLTQLDPGALGAEVAGGAPPFIRFSAEAHDFAKSCRADLAVRFHDSEISGALRCHLSKYLKLFASLSLVLHVLECVDKDIGGDIPLETTQRAASWCRFLEAHARRIYGMAIQ